MVSHLTSQHNSDAKTSLWQNFLSLRQLDDGWDRVRQNNGCSGGDNVTIAMFQNGSGRRVAELAEALRAGTYSPAPYRILDIPKKKGGSRRLLIPAISDRIVHTALAQVLTPILDPQFEESSFAYRPGRSVKQAVQAIERWRDAGFQHVIEADIVGFFDAIEHDRLLGKLEAALTGYSGGVEIVSLVATVLHHQSEQTGVIGRGVAQGSPLSPLLANLYLDALDEELSGKGVRLVRFADDFVILCKKRNDAYKALEEATDALETHGLELHQDGTRIVDFDRGFSFLGHLFVRTFALPQVSDPMEDPVTLLREIAVLDAKETKTSEQASSEATAGYDAGERVLYLTQPGRRLGLRNLSFAITHADGRELAAIAHHRVGRIEVGPGVRVEAEVYEHCLSTQTDITLVDGFGAPRGVLSVPRSEPAALHLKQAEYTLEPASRIVLAKALVNARIRNQRTQLFRLNRRPALVDVRSALVRMGRQLRKLDGIDDIARLRGLEGAVAADYWPALGLLSRDAPTPMRRSRPAKDPINASLNYLAAILSRDVSSSIIHAGLHPGFGTLHTAQDRGDALVYDLMEPFRAPLVEGVVAYLFNARRLRAEMFAPIKGGVRIERSGRDALIQGYEAAVAKRVNVTGRSYKLAWRPLMRRQAQDLAGAFRKGEIDRFLPYVMEA